MHVIITGSSGLIGSALVEALRQRGDRVTRLVRSAPSGEDQARWDPAGGTIDTDALTGADAVVHLAGVGIGDKRWNAAHLEAVRSSRVDGTGLLARTLADLDEGPRTLLSGSAIGYYGDTGNRSVDESAPVGSGVLAEICQAWEQAAEPAVAAGLRVAYLRTGVVQSPEGGALAKQLLPFKLGLGGRQGSGQQWISWITLTDEVAAILFLLDNEIAGPVNLTAPEPVTNADFASALGRALGRPAVLPLPGFVLKTLLGSEMAQNLVLGSQRVIPGVLSEAGFSFAHPEVEGGLRAELGR